MGAIERIRKSIVNNKKEGIFGGMDDTAITLRNLWVYDNASLEDSYIDDRGDRWTHWKIDIFKIELEDEIAYFAVESEIGRTENQSDGVIIVKEVRPKKVEVIRYEEVT